MYDYLIVGQGLAGTILSYKLIKAGHKVLVLNDYNPQCASYVAAGIFSPITGQRIAKLEHATSMLDQAYALYHELEQELHVKFFHEMPYIKLAVDQKLVYYITKRITDPAYASCITPLSYAINDKLIPGIKIHKTGYVDTNLLLDTYRAYLQ